MEQERVKDTYLSKIKTDFKDQSQLFDYSEDEPSYTKIAVVRQRANGIGYVTDEHMPEVAPPYDLLQDFWGKKYNTNATHNQAWDKVNFEERYRDYMEQSIPQEALESLIQRIKDGERVTLVCYEKPNQKCHRKILKEIIEGNL
jgi:uncharacterized protein YeaO (DUF488 family)